MNADNRYESNLISNNKYSVVSFVPKFLQQQFKMFMNQFFLFMCLIQLVPLFNVGLLSTTAVPIITVLLISMVKELIEVTKIYKRDKEINLKKF